MENVYNIEFSHIYANEPFSGEQLNSIRLAKKKIKEWEKEKIPFVTSVLIDDYNVNVSNFDHEKLVSLIEQEGIKVDFVGFESKFGKIAEQLIKEIPNEKTKLEYFNEKQKEVLILNGESRRIGLSETYNFSTRHTCAILSAAWSLCRLGVYPIPTKGVINRGSNTFAASKNFTILPKKYAGGETKVREIISLTRFKSFNKKIEYQFF